MHATSETADVFEQHRSYLTGLAYRMLASMTEAQDVVQEAYLRWHGVNRGDVRNARAFLARIVTRLCLDEMKSARARREVYVGPWLPEPVLNDAELSAETASEYAHDLSVGLLLALERLSPLERAAFLLHDVFDVDFSEVAELLGRNETACRQLASRARTNVRSSHPRFSVSPQTGEAITKAFAAAAATGDVSTLAGLLSEDAVLHSDGGGKARAALNIIVGRDRIVRFIEGISRKFLEPKLVDMWLTTINGMSGFIMAFSDGSLQTTALEIAGSRITSVYVVRNPDKLSHIAKALPSGDTGSRYG